MLREPWQVVGVDSLGLTVEWSGLDLDDMPEWMGRAAQSEFTQRDPVIYMLIEPQHYALVGEQEGGW